MTKEKANSPEISPAPAPAPVVETKEIDAAQKVETNAYVPTYKIRPEFKKALLAAVGDLPFNQIAGLMQAIDVDVIDHQTLTQILNAIGQFPFTRVEGLMKNVNTLVEQVLEEG
jgi:hypothetical protein